MQTEVVRLFEGVLAFFITWDKPFNTCKIVKQKPLNGHPKKTNCSINSLIEKLVASEIYKLVVAITNELKYYDKCSYFNCKI